MPSPQLRAKARLTVTWPCSVESELAAGVDLKAFRSTLASIEAGRAVRRYQEGQLSTAIHELERARATDERARPFYPDGGDRGADVADAGGQPAAGVTKTTNILVEGYQDLRKLRPGEGLSAKARKAEALRAAGQEIELMHEEDFLQRLTV
jgi:hypothetical protein